jgi:uncharacterized protein YqgC (DUF456 family)
MGIALIGVVVPVLPGLLIVWILGVATTLWVGADTTGWVIAGVLTVLFAAGTAATIWLPARQGRQGGAPASSMWLAALGGIVGFFVIPVVGLLVGAAAGLYLAEQRRLGSGTEARRSVTAVVRAYGVGVVVELVLGLLMIIVWLVGALVR